MLVDAGAGPIDIEWVNENGGGLGIFIRQLVGLDRSAAMEAFESFLDDTIFSVNQIRFVNLIVDELTRNGVMEPTRLFEPPYTDHALTGPDMIFADADVDTLVRTLREIRATASASDVA
jgi:Type I site-specific restriction-modification system, R (restriction) subunit and related helicases